MNGQSIEINIRTKVLATRGLRGGGAGVVIVIFFAALLWGLAITPSNISDAL